MICSEDIERVHEEAEVELPPTETKEDCKYCGLTEEECIDEDGIRYREEQYTLTGVVYEIL